ncbi:MAG: Hsp20/alpha crystallin family protein [Victivallaceae bacterium]|nr:Hsp20/alpha crystallin family protein [Victivallaceae bacterium]
MDNLLKKSSVFDPCRAIQLPFGGNLRTWLAGMTGFTDFTLFDSKIELETTEDEVILKMPSPGCAKEDFEIGLTGDFATVRVRRAQKAAENASGGRCVYRERNLREYEESVRFPVPVIPGRAEAHYADGVLTIKVAREKSAPQTARAIRIETE